MSFMAVVFLAVVLPTITPAAEDAWACAAVKPGVMVVVMDKNGRTHRGRLLEWAAGSVALQTETERFEIARERVALIRAPGPLGNLQTVFAPWENLAQVPSGHAIRVIRATGLPVDGELFGIMKDGVQLTRRGKIVFIRRDDIRKVRIQVRSKTDIGLHIGATTGFVVAILVLVAAAQSGNMGGGAEILESGAVGGGKAGGAFDRLFDEYQTIYVSQRR